MITVVNIYKHKKTTNDYRIHRGTPLGNPYTHQDMNVTKAIFQCESREECIAKHIVYLNQRIKTKDKDICKALNDIFIMAQKGDVNLVCYCKPASCHGDYIKQIIDAKINSAKT